MEAVVEIVYIPEITIAMLSCLGKKKTTCLEL